MNSSSRILGEGVEAHELGKLDVDSHWDCSISLIKLSSRESRFSKDFEVPGAVC